MYPPGGAVDMPQITVQICPLDLPPAPVFLHQLKQGRKLRLMLPAPVCQQDHGFIIRRLLILGRGLYHRQAEVIVKITFERGSGGVGPDLHVPGNKGDFLPDFCDPSFGRCLLFLHSGPIHEQAVIPHKAAIDRRGAFNLFHNAAVLRQVLIKPAVENMIEPQGIVAVSAGIVHRFRILREKLVEEPPAGHAPEIRQLRIKELRHKGFEAAVREVPKLGIAL